MTTVTLDGGATIVYEYDDASKKAKGRLHRITDGTGETSWTYNSFGDVTSKTQKIGTVSLTTDYQYLPNGQLEWMRLPSGKVIYYGYDLYLPDSVTVDSETILHSAEYEPFGPIKQWTWGNSMLSSRDYDTRGLLIGQTMLSYSRVLGYDNVGRLNSLDDGRPIAEIDYSELVPEQGTFNYDVIPYSNQLDTVSGPVAKDYDHDAAGNVTSDGIHSFGYDDRGRLNSVDAGVTATYWHNGQGQRVRKVSGSTTLFVYDEAGNLIGEYDGSGTPLREHVWFNGAPVAVLSGANAYYVHTDHLGTPRVISDGAEEIWRWVSTPFGANAADEDPDDDSVSFVYNLRFPGQYFDAETGLHYNYFRTYDPSTGRYLESDPIGLEGGRNTYGYVGGNPLSATDPYGLDVCYVLFPDYPITYNDSGDTSTWLGGHAGILGYDDQGRTRYYEYGRYSPDREGVFGEKFPSSRGNVRRQSIPDLEMGEDGQPTPESMERLKKALEDLAGKGTEAELSCDSEADEQKVYDFAEALAHDKNRKNYNWKPFRANHCRTFAKQALQAGQ